MATFTAYEVRSEQSGILLFASNSATARADCVTQAAALKSQYPNDILNIIPAGYSNGSDRPAVSPAPAAGQTVIAAYT